MVYDQETINYVKNIIREQGSDAWWQLPVEDLLPESYCNKGKTYRKGTEQLSNYYGNYAGKFS